MKECASWASLFFFSKEGANGAGRVHVIERLSIGVREGGGRAVNLGAITCLLARKAILYGELGEA